MLYRVLDTIEKYNMITKGDRVLVGVSGGADSMALLHILKRLRHELGIEIYVAHINHGLRGEDADADAAYVEDICIEWGIPFFLKKACVSELAKEWRLSEEEAGRRVRFSFFDEVLRQIDGNKIALAHHRDDQVETIIHNIIRGTGMEGLRGIKPIRDNKIIRPLIEVDRVSIEEYLAMENIPYRHDHTNDCTIYTRNKIRHELIPYIEENFNPNFKESIIRMTEIIGDEDEFLSDYVNELIDKNIAVKSDKVFIPLDFLTSCHVAVKRRIVRTCIDYLCGSVINIGQKHIDSILDVCNSNTGTSITLPLELTVYRDYNAILLIKGVDKKKVEFNLELKVPGLTVIDEISMEIQTRYVDRFEFKDPYCVYIDGDRISNSLRIRNRLKGDRFRPLGMKGSKKLKDFFIDEKIPKYMRDNIPLVVDGNTIVWVVGYQISDDYKITDKTKNIIELRAKQVYK